MRSATLLACVLATLAAATPARADHTPAPGTVALVGSLQSELGCPGDWQPECAATRLQPVTGSDGLFRGSFAVPAAHATGPTSCSPPRRRIRTPCGRAAPAR